MTQSCEIKFVRSRLNLAVIWSSKQQTKQLKFGHWASAAFGHGEWFTRPTLYRPSTSLCCCIQDLCGLFHLAQACYPAPRCKNLFRRFMQTCLSIRCIAKTCTISWPCRTFICGAGMLSLSTDQFGSVCNIVSEDGCGLLKRMFSWSFQLFNAGAKTIWTIRNSFSPINLPT